MTVYLITHDKSAPTKRRKEWDFLAITNTRAEAERLPATMPEATGIKEKQV